ncbi:hypothetical protein EDB84DRAFT_1446220 [Lactarius hengduanensis]|nr:hypothetical protein EDB84DRAFT_1446220 [Lactarius hengduanensis]
MCASNQPPFLTARPQVLRGTINITFEKRVGVWFIFEWTTVLEVLATYSSRIICLRGYSAIDDSENSCLETLTRDILMSLNITFLEHPSHKFNIKICLTLDNAHSVSPSRSNKGITNESHNLTIPDLLRFSYAKQANANHAKTCILRRSRLQEIWDDMEKKNYIAILIGDKGQGKISADGQQVFCTVHLIMTLGCLWGPLPPDSHENQLLKNFCDLIVVTKITAGRAPISLRPDNSVVLLGV